MEGLSNSGSKDSDSKEDEKGGSKAHGGLHTKGQFLAIRLRGFPGLEHSLGAFLRLLVSPLDLHLRVVLRDSLLTDPVLSMIEVLKVSLLQI